MNIWPFKKKEIQHEIKSSELIEACAKLQELESKAVKLFGKCVDLPHGHLAHELQTIKMKIKELEIRCL